MLKHSLRRVSALTILCGALALPLSADLARALDAGVPAAPIAGDPSVEKAIQSVYPALVQIHVLTLAHTGGRERKFEAAGSGAVISADGYVVTNHHVAGRAAALKVVLSTTREELDAKLIGTDTLADLAILKLDLASRKPGSPPIPFAKFGRSSKLKIGDVVLAMGCPLALSHSVTKGIVANVDLMTSKFIGSFDLDGEDVGSLVKWIGHDAQIQGGNSGGPLVNLAGEIVGINEIGLGTMSGAIPSDIAEVVCKELIEHGKVRRPWIGAEFQPLLSGYEGDGVLIAGVVPGSPAERAGLKAGDIALAVNDIPARVHFREELPGFHVTLLAQPAEKPMAIKVKRAAGGEAVVSVESELRDDAIGKEIEQNQWGLTVREITTPLAKEMQRLDKKGVMVGSVRAGGPCDQAQPSVRPGDIILEVAGQKVDDLEAFKKVTVEITKDAKAPVPTLVQYERRSEKLLTLVEVGIKTPQDPTPEARKAWFPASTQVLAKKLANALGLKGKKGVRICQVYPESEAEKAGFLVGDILTHIDGTAIEASEPQDAEVFDQMIRQYKIGSTAEFTVVRGKETVKVTSTLNEAPKPERELKVHEDHVLEFKTRDVSYFDRLDRRWSKDVKGALVCGIESGGWAAFGGLGMGDLIQGIDGKPVNDVKDLEAALKAIHEKHPKQIALLVRRGIHTRFVELEPTWPEALPADKK